MRHLLRHISLVLLAILLGIVPLWAQQSALRFSSEVCDLGHIAEDGGCCSGTFKATNCGQQSIEVVEIITTCGCTSAIYTPGSVGVGEEFIFEVRYDPMNRPGRIDKSIFVRTSDSKTEIPLRIVGYVQPRQRSIDEIYPFDMGEGLRLRSNFHAFGYLEGGKSLEERIGYVNTSDQTISLSYKYKTSSGLIELSIPQRIAPAESGDIILSYSLADNSDIYGTLTDVITLIINNKEARYSLSAQAIAIDNFDLSDDISAPKAVISKNIIKFGEIFHTSEPLTQSITLRNEGASPLVVRKVESASEAVELILERGTTVAPGQSIEVCVRLKPQLIKSELWEDMMPFVAQVRLITNDPLRPLQSLKVTALPKPKD